MDLHDCHWCLEHIEDSIFFGFFFQLLGHAVGCQAEDYRLGLVHALSVFEQVVGEQLRDLPAGLEAVHDGHMKVGHDQVEHQGVFSQPIENCLIGLKPVVSRLGDEACAFKQLTDNAFLELVIIDHQD